MVAETGQVGATLARRRPRILDLFCGAGGAAVGYHRAGFDVVGVDIEPQPNYPFEFHQGDALTWPLDGYDVIHASPVCLTFANVTNWRGNQDDHPDTLTPTLARFAGLAGTGVQWVVENVPEAPLRADVILCGSQFGLPIKRHRIFQTSWDAFDLMPPCQHHRLLPFMHKGERAYADAMGCTWMSNVEARQAIPPAYTEYIGGQLLAVVGVGAGG
jgi:DNA (cytosine-5)-methyltransferase 1